MGYMHIENLYRERAQQVLQFKRVYSLEKVHGTSCNLEYKDNSGSRILSHFPGGESMDNFKNIFKGNDKLIPGLENFMNTMPGEGSLKIFGEGYGGKCQKQGFRYGDRFNFIVFDVQRGDFWLDVPDAEKVALELGLEFVPYVEISTDLAELDKERDALSIVAQRRGCGEQEREGIVIRPKFECTNAFGERIMAKHKGAKFSETKKITKVGEKPEVLTEANAIADNWCTEIRLEHVLDKIPNAQMSDIPKVINAMLEDITREASGEIVINDDTKKAIRNKTVAIFKKKIQEIKA